MGIKIGINGFGRIGRNMLRAALNNEDAEIVAINDLMEPDTIVQLLKYDSVHGRLDAEVKALSNAIEVSGKKIVVTSIKAPAALKWKEFGVDIAVESTGLFRDRENAGKHLAAGAKKVIISAPGKDPDITIVLGVNADEYDGSKHHIISNASCTTNCLAPVAKVLNEKFGIVKGFLSTVHAYTGDQRLLDAPHKDLRRARAAALSMIPTTTGAAKAVALVLPELSGKLNGLAVRVPTSNVSLIDLVVLVEKENATVEEVNGALKEASESYLANILGYSELPLVSVDFNGEKLSSVVDAPYTYVAGNLIKVLSWYDNETGYANRMIELAVMIGKKL